MNHTIQPNLLGLQDDLAAAHRLCTDPSLPQKAADDAVTTVRDADGAMHVPTHPTPHDGTRNNLALARQRHPALFMCRR